MTISMIDRPMFRTRYGPVALIAGASEGLGAAFARALAARGLDLVLIARRAEPLARTAAELSATYGVRVREVPCDLADPLARRIIFDATRDLHIGCLVYNAAYSHIGPFVSANSEEYDRMTSVNVAMPMALLHHFGRGMLERRRGGAILMSSLAGFQGSGFLAAYGATKAFNRVLAEGLWYEWRGKGVDILACCAGATATPNYLLTRPAKPHFMAPRPSDPHAVAEDCLKHLGKTPSFISGNGNKAVSFLMQRLMPRKSAITMMGGAMRSAYNFQD
jgi:short-subunit dehydrogenase